MVLPLYLAMTAAEIRTKNVFAAKLGWMACHFSLYGTGLSNCPASLPEGSMLILNDRTPIHGHDRALIVHQLTSLITELKCDALLLDFQRPGEEETAALVKDIAAALPCPVGVSEPYARDLACPVFLPPVPPDTAVVDCLAPWTGREVWLEAALEGMVITLTPEGSYASPLPYAPPAESDHADRKLHCHYRIETDENARFTLFRTPEDLHALLDEASAFGVTRAVGLYQELGAIVGNL